MDKLVKMLFTEKFRWEYGIEKARNKNIHDVVLRSLCDMDTRVSVYEAIRDGKYEVSPPHTAKIPKDDGSYRTVYVNEPQDRVVLGIVNDLLFDTCPDMVHEACSSYLRGIGTGMVVQNLSRRITSVKPDASGFVGFKADLSKYFDSVPLELIDGAFDKVEERNGKSAIVDMLRRYYRDGRYYDENGILCEKFQSLKQGCSVSSFLADVMLYDIDDAMSSRNGHYVRYSDDIMYIGSDYKDAFNMLQEMLANKGLSLNPKKVEYVTPSKWVKFLGFSIKGEMISLSKSRLETFENEVLKRCAPERKNPLRSLYSWLYGFGADVKYCWAKQVLSVINVKSDIGKLDMFVRDAIRAHYTLNLRIGGLGYDGRGKYGCITRGRGRNVNSNREKMERIDDYRTMWCMKRILNQSSSLFDSYVKSML